MTRTAVHVRAEVQYEQFVERERAYFFALATEDERAESVGRIVEYLDQHPDVALKTLCKDVAGDEWAALEQRVIRSRKRQKPQVEDVPKATLNGGAIRQARSFIARAPDEVVASLNEEQLDALHAAVVDRRSQPSRPRPQMSSAEESDEVWRKEAHKHECANCWFHCPSGRYAEEAE